MKFYSPITLENWKDLLESQELVIRYSNGEFTIELNDSLIAEMPAWMAADQLKKEDEEFHRLMSHDGGFEFDTFDMQDFTQLSWATCVMIPFFEEIKKVNNINL